MNLVFQMISLALIFLALILHDNANNIQFVVIIGIYALQCSFSSLATLGPKMSIAGRKYQ